MRSTDRFQLSGDSVRDTGFMEECLLDTTSHPAIRWKAGIPNKLIKDVNDAKESKCSVEGRT
jgi:hypothetical protein